MTKKEKLLDISEILQISVKNKFINGTLHQRTAPQNY